MTNNMCVRYVMIYNNGPGARAHFDSNDYYRM